MNSDDLATSVVTEHDESGTWGVSVFSIPGLTTQEIISGCPLPHGSYRASTAGAIRGLGLEIERDPSDPCHCLIVFADEPCEEDWNKLRSVFSPPERNPNAR
jgi:hypothetical protein